MVVLSFRLQCNHTKYHGCNHNIPNASSCVVSPCCILLDISFAFAMPTGSFSMCLPAAVCAAGRATSLPADTCGEHSSQAGQLFCGSAVLDMYAGLFNARCLKLLCVLPLQVVPGIMISQRIATSSQQGTLLWLSCWQQRVSTCLHAIGGGS